MTPTEKLRLAIVDATDVLDDLGIKYGPINDVVINYRSVRRWGQCSYSRATGKYTIEISIRLLNDDNIEWEAVLNTVIHEFLHAYSGRMCHTGEWKRCADLVNKKYPIYNIKRCSSADEIGLSEEAITSSYNYKISCNKCGTISYCKRKSKVVKLLMAGSTTCKCRKCGNNTFTVQSL